MIATVTLLCGFVVLFYFYLTWHYQYWRKKGVPGPKPSLFVGNIPGIVTRKRNFVYDINDIYNEYRGKHRLVGFYNMRTPQILAIDPGLVKEVLVKNFKDFHDNEFADMIEKEVDPIFASNPFMSKGEQWKEKRAEITPAFTTSRLKAMYPLVEKVSLDMIDYINAEIEKESPDGIDAREMSAKYTTDVVSNCIFAVEAESFKNSNAEIRKMGQELLAPGFRLMLIFLTGQVAPFLKHIIRVPFVPKHIEKFFTQIMHDAIAYRLKSNIDRADFLHYLLELREKKNLTDLEMVSHAIAFFIDGFETSSIGMAFTLYELAKNKRVQDKLRAEIKDFESKGPLSFESVSEMPYLNQVLAEVLRLNPPVMYISKKCVNDCTLVVNENDPSSEFKVEKGVTTGIPILAIHRDPENYKDPLTFIPERFDPENGDIKAFKDKGLFLPFGDGPRICLGQKFAQMQAKAGLTQILKNFELTLNSKTQEPLMMAPEHFINIPVGGIWVNFEKLK